MAALPDSANATTLDSSTTSATLDLFRAVLGPVNTDYYLKAFTRFDARDHAGPSWNWAAALLTLNWMALRQLWGAALAYVGAVVAATLLVLGIARLALGLAVEAQLAGMGAVIALSIAVPGIFGNAWLYNASRKKMERSLTANATLADACAMLRRQAASKQRVIGLGIGNAVLWAGIAAIVFSMQGVPGSAVQPPVAEKVAPVTPLKPGAPANTASAAAHAIPAASSTSAAASAPLTLTALPTPPSASASAPEIAVSAPRASASSAALASPQQSASPEKKVLSAAAKKSAKPAKSASDGVSVPVSEAGKKFLVNVGLFADENNARNAAAKLEDAGIPVLVNEMETAKGKRTRVRAGPFASQPEAERAADKIQFIGLDAIVVRK